MAFADQQRFAFNKAFLKQTTQGTALVNADMNAVLPCTATVRRVQAIKGFPDCTNLFLRRRQLQAHYFAITLSFEGSAHVIGGFTAGCMGISAATTGTDPKTHEITMLPGSARELSLHTFIVGTDEGSGEAWKYKDACIARISNSAASGLDTAWKTTVDILASGDRAAVTGYTWPDCLDEAPAQLEDGTLVIGGSDYMDQTRAITCEFNNAVFTSDAPFVAGSKEVKRWLYGNAARSYVLSASIIATDRPGDTVAQLLYANDGVGTEETDTAMRIGTAGNGVTYKIPLCDAAADDAGQASYGEAAEQVLNFIAVAKKADGDADSPMSATAVIPSAQQATAFEVAG